MRPSESEPLERYVPEDETAAGKRTAWLIGEQLNAEGGFDLMQAVGRRTQELSEAPRYLEFWWNGIGRWQT